MHMIQALFPIIALAGSIICGLCLVMGTTHTKWSSPLGRWAIAGLLFLAIGMFGWMYNITTMSETTAGQTTNPITIVK